MCSICGRDTAEAGRLARGDGGAICRDCVSVCSDFFGATDKLASDAVPASVFPTSSWDLRAPNTWVPGQPNAFDRRGRTA